METGLQQASPQEITLHDDKFSKIQAELKQLASDRKKAETPSQLVKLRDVGGGKVARYVDRPVYQDALDREFPGWSIIGEPKYWTEYGEFTVVDQTTKLPMSQKIPVLFNCSIILQVVEKTGTIRRVSGIGSCPVAQSEMSRANTQLLSQKYTIALTDAIKTACNWLGLFFDLRADAQLLEDSYTKPTPQQEEAFNELMEGVPEQTKAVLAKKWLTQNGATAEDFLREIRLKKEKAKEKQV